MACPHNAHPAPISSSKPSRLEPALSKWLGLHRPVVHHMKVLLLHQQCAACAYVRVCYKSIAVLLSAERHDADCALLSACAGVQTSSIA